MVKYKKSKGEIIFEICNTIFMVLLVIVTLYPVYYVLIASVSDPMKILEGNGLLLYPKDFSLENYKTAFEYAPLWIGYRNTIFYVTVTVVVAIIFTVMGAYALTRREVPGQSLIMFMIVLTMYFSGGLIPTYMVMRELHLLDTIWAVLLPGILNTYNLIVTMSYFRGLPYELEEAAKMDGASEYTVLFKILLPLAKPVVAVIGLYYMVSEWNSYFGPMIYLSDPQLKPLQVVLREILIQNQADNLVNNDGDTAFAEGLKYAVIIIASAPLMAAYPFIQKYFVKGVTVGAVKG
ncbi:MAG: carbohydrate ABC transporter permease [Lachnospiraceae bacterium]|nr:carbohydrate ABC transporter permease [Lachnospiraceae bacterium]